jgi:hypothetical protein
MTSVDHAACGFEDNTTGGTTDSSSAPGSCRVTSSGVTSAPFLCMLAEFGTTTAYKYQGTVHPAVPATGCGPLAPAPQQSGWYHGREVRIVVAVRGGCTFQQKAVSAQEAGFDAIVVINDNGTRTGKGSFPP